MTAKTDALLIRLTPGDRARLQRIAEAHYLDASTWARQILLQAMENEETDRSAVKPSPRKKSR